MTRRRRRSLTWRMVRLVWWAVRSPRYVLMGAAAARFAMERRR